MSDARDSVQARPRAVQDTRHSVARMAGMVCEATRQAALEGVSSALSIATDGTPKLSDLLRDVADRMLSRATLMQIEIDKFMAVSRGWRRTQGDVPNGGAEAPGDARPSSRRNKVAVHLVTTFIASDKERTKCHTRSFRQATSG